MAGGQALHTHRQDVSHAPFGLALGFLLDLADAARRLVLGLILDLFEEQLLGPRGRQPGELLERALDFLPGCAEGGTLLLYIRLSAGKVVFPACERSGAL